MLLLRYQESPLRKQILFSLLKLFPLKYKKGLLNGVCAYCCQNITKCPAHSKQLDLGAGCKSMAENLHSFFAIGALPFDVKQNQLDDGSGLFNTKAWGVMAQIL